ncbi:unnamed protein product [Leptosia nina]|uniref:EMI domain-containing protein n=1 Tax=Leptosia nina TaxID=320188 RepID=A0AAV1JBR3_9NEOP
MIVLQTWPRTKTVFCVTSVLMVTLLEVASLSGPNVCMVHQKYNVTKRVKYRAPMSVRTYEWCLSMPPRCSRWKTEMRDLTRLETQERTAEVAVCCPGYKMKDVTCVPICPNGKTGSKCSEECPPNKWGPNCVNECKKCLKGICSPVTGECECLEGWQGESCNIRMTTPPPPALMEELLTTTKSTVQTIPASTKNTVTTTTVEPTMPVSSTLYNPISTELSATFNTESTSKMIIMPKSSITAKPYAYRNASIAIEKTTTRSNVSQVTTTKTLINFIYNRTETPTEGTSHNFTSAHDTATSEKTLNTKSIFNPFATTLVSPIITSTSNSSSNMLTTEIPKKFDTHIKFNSSATKFKPKEIWIKPTQKGISPEIKLKINQDLLHVRNGTKKDTTEITTPRTIVVSIIPTSVSHASFKKIALTTASYFAKTKNVSRAQNQSVENGYTKSMTTATSTQAPFTIKILTTKQRNVSNAFFSKKVTHANVVKTTSKKELLKAISPVAVTTTTSTISPAAINATIPKSKTTNSMTSASSTIGKPSNTFNTSNAITSRTFTNKIFQITTESSNTFKNERKLLKDETFRSQETLKTTTAKQITNDIKHVTSVPLKKQTKKTNQNHTTKIIANIISTERPPEDETFHILTEPEHITAVMSDKEKENKSLDLISVVSVAGGIMMAVITVAVIIVMFERCRRPRYDDVRKINDIRMQVMLDNDDVPPPYVRSIFHTPLPDPPISAKCHYQPISTLDRNLKQFMRPVVVQNISPIMLENFRGILECHYDHLPRRSHDISARSSTAPSINYDENSHRTLADYTIDALKCEAKLDVINNANSEPLYAEIPCWRPPSEHAIEIMNLNGEAVTEL